VISINTHSEEILRIKNAYDGFLTKAYISCRFKIISIDILDILDRLLPQSGRILDVGCGFGLFASYLHLRKPERTIYGFDLSEKRIREAQRMSQRLSISDNLFFNCMDVRDFVNDDKNWDAIYCLDLLHHVPPGLRLSLLKKFFQMLSPGGILVIKDVTNRPIIKALFTWAMDQIVAGPCRVWYNSIYDQQTELCKLGFFVDSKIISDILPYPHVIFRCTINPANLLPDEC